MLLSIFYTMWRIHLKVLGGYVQRFTRRCIYKKIHILTFDLGPLHHVTYLGTKFEVPLSNGLRGDAFT